MITGVHHIAISSPDIDRLARFYKDAFGFREVSRASWPAGSEDINAVMGLKDSAAQTTMLNLENLHLEIFQFSVPEQEGNTFLREVHRHGITHMCFDVADIDREYQRLKELGAEFHCPPKDFGAARATYGRDPDGNVFELQELINTK